MEDSVTTRTHFWVKMTQQSNLLMAILMLVTQKNINSKNSNAGVNNMGFANNAHVDNEAIGYNDGTTYADDVPNNITTNDD